ncbi:MAG TPA: methyltransferase domain-containing protein [Flexivirga sp.]|uniref:class I SAM-dependent DNA methyltransferase n=1 Tax=Flexivirga sp. TaxID=1962927 RepID=UPI002D028C9C|nr:methyltransferase domain-containing protein [Flexivirga sp.]HWC23473.1 methyltransferase domain-containing protein [Flexivirga sp.]
MRPPDAGFADPRLAVLYDFFDDDRSDLDVYEAIVDELRARKVVDVGCGTGSLAVRLAARGIEVIGVDPAVASIDVACTKPYADGVTWLEGDATTLTGRVDGADLAVMTGNVAQVFVDDADWAATLSAIHGALRDGGWFVFETRRPEMRAWEQWTTSPAEVVLPDGRRGTDTMTVTEVALPLVTFESMLTLADETLKSVSTLRFRERAEIEDDLRRHGFEVMDVRDAPDRPGREWVFLAQLHRE